MAPCKHAERDRLQTPPPTQQIPHEPELEDPALSSKQQKKIK